MPLPRRCTAALAAGVLVLSLPASSLADEARDALIVETILRIEGFDLQGSAKAQAAVARYLKSNWAGERYLDLIERFIEWFSHFGRDRFCQFISMVTRLNRHGSHVIPALASS